MFMPMSSENTSIEKIVSGGQTGADRAGLDWALKARIPHGGWCPRGRRAEDGVIPAEYQLVETPARDYDERTAWNVRDSDGTAIFSCSPALSGGSALTQQLAEDLGRPVIHVHAGWGVERAAEALGNFLRRYDIKTLNIAGPRQSHEPEVGVFVEQVLALAFVDCRSVSAPARLWACLRLGRLASANQLMQQTQVVPDARAWDGILQDLESQAVVEHAQGNRHQAQRMRRRILALQVFRAGGLDQARLIRPVDLPGGYAGKILLVSLTCAGSEGRICLRCGDLWHREILHAAKEEIADLGFDLTSVSPVGGAWVSFDEGQVISLYGSSQEFGACDKPCAAQLIADTYPQHRIRIR